MQKFAATINFPPTNANTTADLRTQRLNFDHHLQDSKTSNHTNGCKLARRRAYNQNKSWDTSITCMRLRNPMVCPQCTWSSSQEQGILFLTLHVRDSCLNYHCKRIVLRHNLTPSFFQTISESGFYCLLGLLQFMQDLRQISQSLAFSNAINFFRPPLCWKSTNSMLAKVLREKTFKYTMMRNHHPLHYMRCIQPAKHSSLPSAAQEHRQGSPATAQVLPCTLELTDISGGLW